MTNKPRKKVVKIDPDLFEQMEFKITVKPLGMREILECDCWLCTQATDLIPSGLTPPL